MKSVLILEGLNCPHCAEKIEQKIVSDRRFDNVEFNFINKKLSLEHDMEPEVLVAEIDKIVSDIEDGVNVVNEAKREEENEFDGLLEKRVTAIVRVVAVVGLLLLYLIPFKNTVLQAITSSPAVIAAAYLIAGGDVILKAGKNIAKGRVFDENFLMTIATIGAFLLGEYTEALAVMVFYQIGEFFQDLAVDNSKRSISELMGLKIESVSIIRGGEVVSAKPEDVKEGDILLIRSGEKIPADGVVEEGTTTLDTSALTGESVPRDANAGDSVLSGCINLGNAIKIKAEKRCDDSTAAKISRMAENAAAHKAKAENFISAFAKIYTPAVVIAAVLIAVLPSIAFGFDKKWIKRCLIFLVASCPCSLVLSVPLCFFSGIGKASKQGVLIKGSNYIQTLSKVKLAVFDKTGTITTGRFIVSSADKKTLGYAASLEKYSSHPIAKAIVEAYDGELKDISDVEEISGYGMKGKVDGKVIAVGSAGFMQRLAIPLNGIEGDIYTALDGTVIGAVNIEDDIKEDSETTVRSLAAAGVRSAMLTGDREEKAVSVCRKTGIELMKSDLLPGDKLNELKSLRKKYGLTAFIGDGINDAPVLAGADVGIAMGGIGSDAAIEAADMVIMGDNISAFFRAVMTSRKTMGVLKQNVVFILAVKAVVLLLTMFGFGNMWLAVFADVGTALIAILNSARILN